MFGSVLSHGDHSVTTSRSGHVCASIKSKTSEEVVRKSVGRLRYTEQRPAVSGDWDTVENNIDNHGCGTGNVSHMGIY